MPKSRDDVPSTIERSDKHAEDIWTKTHDSAVDSYGEGERAHRTAFASLKHSYEKVGDRWESKQDKGPSDARAKQTTPRSRDSGTPTAGGVDANAAKEHLYEVAKKLDVPGRSKMDKDQLVEAIDKANNRETAKARRS